MPHTPFWVELLLELLGDESGSRIRAREFFVSQRSAPHARTSYRSPARSPRTLLRPREIYVLLDDAAGGRICGLAALLGRHLDGQRRLAVDADQHAPHV